MNQGEIWRITLDPTVGAELKKTRPAIIVNEDGVGKLPLRIIVPLTSWQDKVLGSTWMVKIGVSAGSNLRNESAADCYQIRSLSVNRISSKIGHITPQEMNEIKKAIARVISISKDHVI